LARVSRAQVFEALREQNVFNLGRVQRMYMEPKGAFTVFQHTESKPGLSLMPNSDDDIHLIQHKAGKGIVACISCGNVTTIEENKASHTCGICGSDRWDAAIFT
jgi:uncharacterized membrane protein YcaP (DUF421 family)